MAHFVVRLSAPVSATEAWERVLDLHAHGEVIPFTTLRPLPHDREHNPDDREHNPDDREHNPDDREHSPDDREHNPDDREHSPDDREHGATGEVRADVLPMSAHGLMPGSRFVARTAWSRVGFDDPMVIEVLRAPQLASPGFVRIRKEGKVIRGWIDLSVVGEGSTAARVTWSQVILVRGLPRLLDPLVAAIARAAYGSALRRLLARH